MSQSPDRPASEVNGERLVQYRNAWSALSQLIGKGRSFSGHERNCCFLNTGNGTFANVSAATGLDLIDDGRAVALVDWDFDGAIDLWVANRTAPRVRLLRNRNQAGHHWLAIKLQGTTCNRDAIGARLVLYSAGETSRRVIKTLHAGDGYLSQSSKWVHFGLGKNSAIDHLDVMWPGGRRERFDGLSADRRYQLVQGSGKAVPWTAPRARAKLVARPIPLPDPSSATRTWIMGRVPLPADQFLDNNGQSISLSQSRGRPLLLNLWSRTCLPCLEELTEWSNDVQLTTTDSLRILALCVDSVDGDQMSATEADRFLRKMDVSFQSGLPTAELLDGMEMLQRTFLEWQQPLPVPCSFLLDSNGRVAAIYKGRLSADQIKDDLQLLVRSRIVQRNAAVPFVGRWASRLFPFNPLPLTRTMELARQGDAAMDYLQSYVEMVENELPEQARLDEQHEEMLIECYRTLGERLLRNKRKEEAFESFDRLKQLAADHGMLHRQLGELLLARGHARQALSHFELALKNAREDAQLRYHMGLAELGRRNVPMAVQHFRASLDKQPNHAATHFHLANALHMSGETAEAVRHYQLALKEQPESPLAANNLAWILATNQDPEIRDGREAVRLAEMCCRASGYADVSALATLAAAYAEAGDFDKAVRTNRQAIELLQQLDAKQAELEKLQHRQTLFESGQSFRQ